MREDEKEMQLIALLSGEIAGDYIFIDCKDESIEHFCEKQGQKTEFDLYEVEYFREGQVHSDKANFCEHCKRVFVFRPD